MQDSNSSSSWPTRIDKECEKAMIQFVCYHKAAKMTYLDTIWREFLKIHPFPEEDEIDESALKLHYLCLEKFENKWDLDEDQFLYFKFGEDIEEYAPLEEDQRPVLQEETLSVKKLLVTFDRKQNLNTGLSWEAFKLCKTAFQDGA